MGWVRYNVQFHGMLPIFWPSPILVAARWLNFICCRNRSRAYSRSLAC